MSDLVVKPLRAPSLDGSVIAITPESAGWTYVGFEVLRLQAGDKAERNTEQKEVCLVLLSGRASIRTRHSEWINIGKRMSVFEKTPPYSVYVPNEDLYEIKALTEVEIAVCSAPGKGTHAARLISPEQVGVETRGHGNV
jgi:5-deoxy-glucuronate isomerase